MKYYFFYCKNDKTKEPISKIYAASRFKAAKYFSKLKKLNIKDFLKCFSVNK
jgi:hypothetical protein